MNMKRSLFALAIIGALFVAPGCTDNATSTAKSKAAATKAAENDPRAKVLGIHPDGTPMQITAPTSATKSTLTKEQEASAMPLPGQANDHSTLAPAPSQKALPTGR